MARTGVEGYHFFNIIQKFYDILLYIGKIQNKFRTTLKINEPKLQPKILPDAFSELCRHPRPASPAAADAESGAGTGYRGLNGAYAHKADTAFRTHVFFLLPKSRKKEKPATSWTYAFTTSCIYSWSEVLFTEALIFMYLHCQSSFVIASTLQKKKHNVFNPFINISFLLHVWIFSPFY